MTLDERGYRGFEIGLGEPLRELAKNTNVFNACSIHCRRREVPWRDVFHLHHNFNSSNLRFAFLDI